MTKIDGVSFAFYSLHICSSKENQNTGHAYTLASEILPIETAERVIVVGDFNKDHVLPVVGICVACRYGSLPVQFGKRGGCRQAVAPMDPGIVIVEHAGIGESDLKRNLIALHSKHAVGSIDFGLEIANRNMDVLRQNTASGIDDSQTDREGDV